MILTAIVMCCESSPTLSGGNSITVYVRSGEAGDDFPSSYWVILSGPHGRITSPNHCGLAQAGFGVLTEEIPVPEDSEAPVQVSTRFEDLGPGCYEAEASGLPANCTWVSDPVAPPRPLVQLGSDDESITLEVPCHPNRIAVKVISTGHPVDIPAGYTVTVDGSETLTLDVPGPDQPYVVIGTVRHLATGDHAVVLSAPPDYCEVAVPVGSDDPLRRTAAVLQGQTTNVSYEVACSGGIEVETVTTGPSDAWDPDGYWITLDGPGGTLSRLLGRRETHLFESLDAGSYTVTLSGEARNCSVLDSEQETERVAGVTKVTFTIDCQPGLPATYTASKFVEVVDPAEIDIDASGNLYVGNSGISTGNPGGPGHVRLVSPSGDVSDFGEAILDPDAVIIDRERSITSLEEGAVLIGGALDVDNLENRITEIALDGSVTQVLIEGGPPDLKNPSSFAFLADGRLLVGNYGTNNVTVLSTDGTGSLQFDSFFEETLVTTGLGSLVAMNQFVYVVTGSGRLTVLRDDGGMEDEDVWPDSESADPRALAVDVVGSFGNGLLAATSDGRILHMDTSDGGWSRIGDLTFSQGVCGMVVSHPEGTLFVAECDGSIWKVTRD